MSDAVFKLLVLMNKVSEQKNDFPTDEDSELDDEDDFDLRDVSSDVEIDPAELDIPSDDDDDEEGDSS